MHASSALIYAALLLLSGMVASAIAVCSWQRRQAPGGMPLFLMMLAMVIWSWTYALHWLMPTWPAAFFWLDATYLGVVSIPAFMFTFTIQLTYPSHQSYKPFLSILAIEPILTLVLLCSDPYHHLFYGDYRLVNTSNILSGGPWFWINIVYSYALLLISFFLLIIAFKKSRGSIYRKQIGVCVAGYSFLFLINFLEILGIPLLPGLDLTPILFTVSGLFFLVSLFSFRMLDIVPVAQDVLLDQMRDGMIVLDQLARVIDINQAAAEVLGKPTSDLIGKDIVDISAGIPDLAMAFEPLQAGSRQIEVKTGSTRVLDVQISALESASTKVKGFLISWRDISQLKRVENELRQVNDALNQNISEINTLKMALEEQVIHDPLTGLFNRRFLETMLPDEFERADRIHGCISLVVMDIDHFKKINDRYGHETGDLVLKQLSRKLESCIREKDWIIRYGGEEFIIIMIDTPIETAYNRADQIRAEIEEMDLMIDSEPCYLTISVGIAVFPQHGQDYEAIFRVADRSLYDAKSSGRNRVVLAA